METPTKDRLADYGFVVTIVWIGFLLAISFLEAPLRFQAESITIVVALQVGRLVFHALNICEIVFGILIFVCFCQQLASPKSKKLFTIAVVILASQTALLFLVLDPRTDSIIAGEEVEKSYHHAIYIFLEFVKLVTLAFLAHSQIRDFKANLQTLEQNKV